MKSLRKILEKRIINFGPISISDFMIESNQNPKFGYYNTSFPFGKNGDFLEEQVRVFLSVRDGSLGCRKHVPTQRRKPG